MFSVDIEEFQGICCCLLLVFQARLLDTIGTTRGFGDHDLKVAFCGLPIKPFLTPQPEVCLFVCLFVYSCFSVRVVICPRHYMPHVRYTNYSCSYSIEGHGPV